MRKKLTEIVYLSERIKGQSVIKVWRVFSESEFETIPEEYREEESDGATYMELTNGITLVFFPNAESYTLDYEVLTLSQIPKEAKNISDNSYWSLRINKKIINLNGLYGDLTIPYGIKLELENGLKIELHYVSESEYTFDALVIK